MAEKEAIVNFAATRANGLLASKYKYKYKYKYKHRRANGLLASSQELKVVEIGGLKVFNLICFVFILIKVVEH